MTYYNYNNKSMDKSKYQLLFRKNQSPYVPLSQRDHKDPKKGYVNRKDRIKLKHFMTKANYTSDESSMERFT